MKSAAALFEERRRTCVTLVACITVCLIFSGFALRKQFVSGNLELLQARERIGAMEQELAAILKRNNALISENQRLKHDWKELPELRGDVTRLRREIQDLVEIPQRREKLIMAFQRNPAAWIPGIRLVPEDAWTRAISSPLSTEEDVRKATAQIRKAAMKKLASHTSNAIKAFAAQNEDRLPQTINDLIPYIDPSLQQEVIRFCVLEKAKGGDSKATLKAHPAILPEFNWSLEVDGHSYHYKIQTGNLQL
jgi:hypothetical protein